MLNVLSVYREIVLHSSRSCLALLEKMDFLKFFFLFSSASALDGVFTCVLHNIRSLRAISRRSKRTLLRDIQAHS